MASNTTNNDMEFWRGDDISFNMVFTDSDNNEAPLDVTGWTVFFTIKNNKSDSDNKAVLQKNFTNFPAPLTGVVPIFVSNTETNNFKGNYFYDFQIKRADGIVLTVSSGGITFLEDTTIRTA